MLTVRDVMNRLGVTQHTVLGWISRGELKAVNVGRTPNTKVPRWRISPEALAAFEAARAAVPTPAARPRIRRPRRSREDDVIQFYA